MTFPKRGAAALLLPSALIAGACAAKQAPPAVTASPAQGAPKIIAANIEPEARALLEQMVAAQKALKSYSATVDLSEEQDGKAQAFHSSVAYERPNRASVRITDPKTKTIDAEVTDGSAIYMTSTAVPTSYGKMSSFYGRKNIAVVLSGSKAFALPVFGLILSEPRAAATLMEDTKSVTRKPDDVVGGVPVDVVELTFTHEPSPVVAFAVGKTDHLVRRISLHTQQEGKTGSATETFTDVKSDPALPESQFAFKPSPGMKEEAQPPLYDARLKQGATPPPFTVKDTSGKPISLAQYKGRVVLLDFWATWCGPCREETPNLVATYNKYHAQGFDVIGVSGDAPEDGAKLTAFTKTMAMPWRQIHDTLAGETAAVATKYGVKSLPTTVLIGRDGKILAVGPSGDDLDEAVASALTAK